MDGAAGRSDLKGDGFGQGRPGSSVKPKGSDRPFTADAETEASRKAREARSRKNSKRRKRRTAARAEASAKAERRDASNSPNACRANPSLVQGAAGTPQPSTSQHAQRPRKRSSPRRRRKRHGTRRVSPGADEWKTKPHDASARVVGRLIDRAFVILARKAARRQKKKEKKERKKREARCRAIVLAAVDSAFRAADAKAAVSTARQALDKIIISSVFRDIKAREEMRSMRWRRLPSRALCAVSQCLETRDRGAFRIVCREWAKLTANSTLDEKKIKKSAAALSHQSLQAPDATVSTPTHAVVPRPRVVSPSATSKPKFKPHKRLFEQAPTVAHGQTPDEVPISPSTRKAHAQILAGIDKCVAGMDRAGGLRKAHILHHNLSQMASSLRALAEDRRPLQLAVVNALRVAVAALWPGARVEVYGSFATELCAPSSDIDLVVCDVLQHYQDILSVNKRGRSDFVRQLARHLNQQKWVQIVKTIERAAVPIIKVTATFQEAAGIQLDLSFDSPSHRGLSTCAFVRGVCAEYPMLVPLTLVLKQFLVTKGLNDPYSGGLSSYGLVLMVTRVLQKDRLHRQYLHALESGQIPKAPGSDERKVTDGTLRAWRLEVFSDRYELGRLFITFLSEYGLEFSPFDHAVSVFNKVEEADFNFAGVKYRNSFRQHPVAIIDPFDQTNNIGRTCYGIGQIQQAFKNALKAIQGYEDGSASQASAALAIRRIRGHTGEERHELVDMKQETSPLGAVFGTLHHQSVVKYSRQLWTRSPGIGAGSTGGSPDASSARRQRKVSAEPVSASADQRPAPGYATPVGRRGVPPAPWETSRHKSVVTRSHQRAISETYTQLRLAEQVLQRAASSHSIGSRSAPGSHALATHVRSNSDMLSDQRLMQRILCLLEADCTVKSCIQQLIGFETVFKSQAAGSQGVGGGKKTPNLEEAWSDIVARCLITKVLTPPSNLLFYRALERDCDATFTGLRKRLVRLSLQCATVLLKSNLVLTDFMACSMLSNLGRWIGCLTLALDKPIWRKLLDVKLVLLDAVKRGRLVAVLPFFVEVLSACDESSVFRLPNPWLAAILRTIRDLNRPGLPSQLRFAIETLFRKLSIRPSDLKNVNRVDSDSDFSGSDSDPHIQTQGKGTRGVEYAYVQRRSRRDGARQDIRQHRDLL